VLIVVDRDPDDELVVGREAQDGELDRAADG
jgi:hypothetical protein